MKKCACQGLYLDKLTQPAILLVLHAGSSYGLSILVALEEQGLVCGEGLDPAGFYRMLKKLEATGLVSSQWDTQTGSKPRRMFTITDEGKRCLYHWQASLYSYRHRLDNLLSAMESAL